MMEQYAGDFLAGVDALRGVLACSGRVWPISTERSVLCAAYADGSTTRGEVEVDAGQSKGHGIVRLWLEPPAAIHPRAAEAIGQFDAVVIGPGSYFTSLMPIFLVRGVREALAGMAGPIVLVSNLLTEGRGMQGFTAGEAVRRLGAELGRPVDVVVFNTGQPAADVLGRYAAEHKEPLALGELPPGCELVTGEFWTRGIARHDRRRLAYTIWSVLAARLLEA
jgi:uncharacterized cofD-like protein